MKIATLKDKSGDSMFKMFIEPYGYPEQGQTEKQPFPWMRWRADWFLEKEPETLAWIDSFDDGGVFWDIGANIGVYSLYCAFNHQNMQIEALEPHKNNHAMLWANINENDYQDRLTAHLLAIGNNDPGTMMFYPGNLAPGSSGGQLGDSNGYKIKTTNLDDFGIIYGCPDYLKIDTDGNEYDIMLGGQLTIGGNRWPKSILVEINNHESDIHAMMTDAGFHIDEKLMALKTRPEHDHNVIFTRS